MKRLNPNESIPGEAVCPSDYVCPVIDICGVDYDPCAFIDICILDIH
ncbi:MAG: hypothetical protein HXS48_09680 [Theionarchaea archaeon]|nr:hypothetical protein [Theionarchaea archaeon]